LEEYLMVWRPSGRLVAVAVGVTVVSIVIVCAVDADNNAVMQMMDNAAADNDAAIQTTDNKAEHNATMLMTMPQR
jgi:hypothetical protein